MYNLILDQFIHSSKNGTAAVLCVAHIHRLGADGIWVGVCRQPSDMSNASQMLQILDLRSLVRLAGCER